MKFCTRFLYEHYQTFQTYKFVWAWWFPRQISLNEYRIGALEYEFVEAEDREIAIHIPSDADLRKDSNIVAFQNLFEIDKLDYDETWYMGWIFPGIENVDENLPEKTKL